MALRRPVRSTIIAVFVDTSESVDDAVHREVFEETAVPVTNVRDFASQPLPFPNSLMLGFGGARGRRLGARAARDRTCDVLPCGSAAALFPGSVSMSSG